MSNKERENNSPLLYIKPTCPWCIEALDYFKTKGVKVEIVDITKDSEGHNRMREVSGQGYVPTFHHGDFIVADFDTQEFVTAVEKAPEIKIELGL